MQDQDVEKELEELRRDYLTDVREKVELLRQHAQALEARRQFKTSFPILLFLSHQMKGSGGSIGFPKISELAMEISVVLNEYLEDDSEPRPSPQQLSRSVLAVVDQLESEVRGV